MVNSMTNVLLVCLVALTVGWLVMARRRAVAWVPGTPAYHARRENQVAKESWAFANEWNSRPENDLFADFDRVLVVMAIERPVYISVKLLGPMMGDIQSGVMPRMNAAHRLGYDEVAVDETAEPTEYGVQRAPWEQHGLSGTVITFKRKE